MTLCIVLTDLWLPVSAAAELSRRSAGQPLNIHNYHTRLFGRFQLHTKQPCTVTFLNFQPTFYYDYKHSLVRGICVKLLRTSIDTCA